MPAEFLHTYIPGNSPVTILALHGTGGDENDLVGVARAVYPGAGILSPRGRVSEHGAARFFRRLAPGVFDEAEIRGRAAELAEWLQWAAGEYGFDPQRLYALGYSNGANMAIAAMLLHPGCLAGGVMLRPMEVIRPEPLPALAGAPILLAAGEADAIAPPRDAHRLARMLADAGAAVDFAVMECGHDLTPEDFSGAKRWFAQLNTAPKTN